MGDKPFIKFYPSDFLAGTSGLTPAERGVYITLLCLIYEKDGAIERNDARLSRRCGCPKASFVRILDALIDDGKITLEGGSLSNNRAEKALMDRQVRSQNSTHAANSRWSALSKKSQQNQTPKDAGAMRAQCGGNASQSPESREEKEEAYASSKKKRGTRIKDDWVLPKDWGEWALAEGWPENAIRLEAQKFHDHWKAAPGQKGVKLDWQATWRNWMRNSKSRKNQRFGENDPTTTDPTLDAIAIAARMRRTSR